MTVYKNRIRKYLVENVICQINNKLILLILEFNQTIFIINFRFTIWSEDEQLVYKILLSAQLGIELEVDDVRSLM